MAQTLLRTGELLLLKVSRVDFKNKSECKGELCSVPIMLISLFLFQDKHYKTKCNSLAVNLFMLHSVARGVHLFSISKGY